ncbi:MAG: histidine kinase, partial [Methanomicrobiales archaeon]|nr:histidine kinase [Methanomicrobiales archaeon]
TAGKTGVVILAQHGDIDLTEKESSIAWWVLVHGQSAGRSTDTLAGGDGYFLPIKGNQQTFGVIGFWFDNPEEMLSADNNEIYDSIASLGALALERVKIK